MSKDDSRFIMRTAKKLYAVNHCGGKCIKCGESDLWKLTFHHRIGDNKDSILARLYEGRLSTLLDEVDKCDLLCANCHRVEHCNNVCDKRHADMKKMCLDLMKSTCCEKCGHNDTPSVYDFHHDDPSEKEFIISNLISRKSGSFEDLLEELNKCSVLCANCHADVHFDHNRYEMCMEAINIKMSKYYEKIPPLDRDEVKRLYQSGMSQKEIVEHFGCAKSTISMILKDVKKRKIIKVVDIEKTCPICNSTFASHKRSQEYCSNECRATQVRVRPDKHDLIKMISESSQSQVARNLGVSRQAVSRWMREYDLR